MSAGAKFTAVQKRQIKAIATKIEQRKIAIAAERDKLRELVEEYQEILDCCERADDSLQEALDALSEQL